MSHGQTRIAICQPGIILGGRLSVIIGIVKILNELGIVPDIITTKLAFNPTEIENKYGKNIKVNYQLVPSPRFQRGEWKTLSFNASLKNYANQYDLLINTSNSLAMLPKSASVLTYMFYPRKSRINAKVTDIHFPENCLKLFTKTGINRWILRRVYQRTQLHPHHLIVAMTGFTKIALQTAYPNLPVNPEIIYPAVDMDAFWCNESERQKIVVTIGRFSHGKRQLTQIQVAKELPDFQFHIFGFTGNESYFTKCKQYISNNQLNNVHLHPNASFSVMLEYLQRAKYFLHTLINEPFGLTAVQAIAAGCIPIVHNSGGQVETVPSSQLQYDNFNQIPSLLTSLEALPTNIINSIRNDLQIHIKQLFDESIFHQKMKTVLVNCLNN